MTADFNRIPPPCALCVRLGLSIEGLGRMTKGRSQGYAAFPERTLQSFALVHLVEGRGRFRARGGEERAVEAGDLIALLPGLPHRYGPDEEGLWKEYWCIFSGRVPNDYVASGLLGAGRSVMRLGQAESYVPAWESLLACADDARENVDLSIRFGAFLARLLADNASSVSSQAVDELVELARAKMAESIGAARFVSRDFARESNLSYSAFRRRFSRSTGSPPDAYLAALTAARAKERLLDAGPSVKEIAEELGFADPYYFSRFFKRHSGMSPRDFRESFSSQGAS